jgi:hypothetical protein
MQIYFTINTILIAAAFGFIVGALWYSPLLFKRAWLYGEGFRKDNVPVRSKLYLFQVSLYSFIAHSAVASIIALLFEFLQPSSLKLAVLLGLLFSLGFIVTVKYIDMLYSLDEEHWKKRVQIKFLVASGYYCASLMVMSLVIYLLGN